MQILSVEKAAETRRWFEEAAKAAANSLCLRAKCGSVIVKDEKMIGRGFNSPPRNNPEYRTCLNEYEIPAGFRHDKTCCIHAEQRAIEDAKSRNESLNNSRIYFLAIDGNGKWTKASDLKCTICSRAVLDAGITEFALYATEGVKVYDAAEFNERSYQYKTPPKS